MTERKGEGKVKVIDRRWFTATGELRDDVPSPPPRPAATAAPTDTAQGEREPAAPAADEPAAGAAQPKREALHLPGPPGFLELLDTLAQPAVAFLSGQVPGRGRDLAAARFYIDLIAVLEEKTRGKLSLEEKNVLDDVLYQLRSLYLAATR